MISYSHTIGIASDEGRGFMNPVDIVLDSENLIYVISRSLSTLKRVRISVQTIDSEFKHEFANWGTEPGQTIQPTSITIDHLDNIYVSDEFMHNISIFKKDGTFIKRWGEFGNKKGELNRPSGIHIDKENNILVVDHLNSRIQKFDLDGNFIFQFGSFGNTEGKLNYPWGIYVDKNNNIWVSDWRNDRIQIFDQNGSFLDLFGSSGNGKGEFNRPSDIHISEKGNIYVSDWGNHRIQIFNEDKNWIKTLYGDATISKWAKQFLDVNPEQNELRNKWGNFEQEKRFWQPTSICSDTKGNIFITDSCRQRVQIYKESQKIK